MCFYNEYQVIIGKHDTLLNDFLNKLYYIIEVLLIYLFLLIFTVIRITFINLFFSLTILYRVNLFHLFKAFIINL